MIRISSRLSLLVKIVILFKGLLFLFISLFLFFSGGDEIALLFIISFSILMILFARSIKIIYRKEDSIICKGFFSKKIYAIDDIEKVGSTFFQFYYLKLKSGKKIPFYGTLKDYHNAFLDSFDRGQKGIEDRLKN